ncbi:unnamed protein product [Angiostrongylus costaricensis]|uniref:DUF4283 domain-containing protein n=1 Tax=Angiostrongylus costaricensis TaxID=334426 RepID=A0A158PFP6_ANGCS|nr:unnamed protein product [Angiostrongylus costaricensis]
MENRSTSILRRQDDIEILKQQPKLNIFGDVEVVEASFGLGLLSEALPPQEVVQILKKWDWAVESIDVRCVAVHYRGKGLVPFHLPMRNVVDDVSGAFRRSARSLVSVTFFWCYFSTEKTTALDRGQTTKSIVADANGMEKMVIGTGQLSR